MRGAAGEAGGGAPIEAAEFGHARLEDEGGLTAHAWDRGQCVEAGLEVRVGGDDLSGASLEGGDFAVQRREHGGDRAGQRRVGVKGLAGAIGLSHAHRPRRAALPTGRGDEFLAAGQRGGEFALGFGRRAIGIQVAPRSAP